MNDKTISEKLFQTYLHASKFSDFRFEPQHVGTLKRPDYILNVDGKEILFEIKQFDPADAELNLRIGAFDPYGRIREKIEAGRKKFKDLEHFCCCLVLYDNGKPLVDLDPQFIYAAMFGNLGIEIPVNTDTGIGDMSRSRQVMHGGGKMFWYVNQESVKPMNTTISAILVLREYLIDAKGTVSGFSISQPRVTVHENPFARIQLPRELFVGRYDERYAVDEGCIGRVFCGSQLAELECEDRCIHGERKNT